MADFDIIYHDLIKLEGTKAKMNGHISVLSGDDGLIS